nr:hypothetical protein [Chloroflexia bacterium]
MTRLRHVCALLVAIAMAVAMVAHPVIGLAQDPGSRSSLLASLALQDDDDDDDDDVQLASAPVSDDDDNDVQPVFDDDDDVQPSPVFDDNDPFGGGAVDEPRTDQVIV